MLLIEYDKVNSHCDGTQFIFVTSAFTVVFLKRYNVKLNKIQIIKNIKLVMYTKTILLFNGFRLHLKNVILYK